MNYFTKYLDPDPADVNQGGDPLDAAIDAASSPAPDAKADAKDSKPDADAKPKTKFAWGDEDRRKTAAEIKEDHILELGYDDEKDGQKTPAKATLKEIRETAKWLKENTPMIKFAQSLGAQFKNNPEWGKYFDTLQAKMWEGGKFNPDVVTKQMQYLEGKAEQIKEAVEDKTDDIKDMEKDLEDLDPESPQAKILKRNINALKATRTQLNEALKANKTMQEKVDGLDKFKGNFEATQQKQKEAQEDERVSGIMTAELSSLTAKDQPFYIEDPDDAKDFNDLTHKNILAATEGDKVKTDEQFKAVIKESAKAAFETIRKRNERVVNAYLQKKQPPKPGGKEVSRETKPGKEDPDALDKLIDASAQEVFTR